MLNQEQKVLVFTARLDGELREFFLREKQMSGVKSYSEALRITLKKCLILQNMEKEFENMRILFRTVIETYEKETGRKLEANNLLHTIIARKELGETLDKYSP